VELVLVEFSRVSRQFVKEDIKNHYENEKFNKKLYI
jgi:hypothetical protein